MRKAIGSTQDGKNATPAKLIGAAKIREKAGHAALRRLEELGEYAGFATGPKRRRR
jgi:hypothetical protein